MRDVDDTAAEPTLDLLGLINGVEAALGINADVAALTALRARLAARAAEVNARLPPPPAP